MSERRRAILAMTLHESITLQTFCILQQHTPLNFGVFNKRGISNKKYFLCVYIENIRSHSLRAPDDLIIYNTHP